MDIKIICFISFYLYIDIYFNKQEPTHCKVGSEPHPAPRGFLSKIGPTGSNSCHIAGRWFFFLLMK